MRLKGQFDVMDVLLIEDSDGDADLIVHQLARASGGTASISRVKRLGQGIEQLREHAPDVILLDLALPDSSGLQTFLDLRAAVPELPIVVLTGRSDEQLALTTVQQGAQDYLVKGEIDGKLLTRCLKYAIERARLIHAQRVRHERELRLLEGYSPRVPVATQMYSVPPLKEHAPGVFDDLVSQYAQLIDLSIEQRMLKVDHHLSERLEQMGAQLGELRAVPRDVVDVHREAIDIKTEEVNEDRRRALIEEGRLLILGLMGKLAAHYRSHLASTVSIVPHAERRLDG